MHFIIHEVMIQLYRFNLLSASVLHEIDLDLLSLKCQHPFVTQNHIVETLIDVCETNGINFDFCDMKNAEGRGGLLKLVILWK